MSIILFTVLVLMSCGSGKKALQKGNYSDAVFKSIERLRSNPTSKNGLETLQHAYPLAVQTLETEINEVLSSNDAYKYSIVAEKYQVLNDMANDIRRSPAALRIIPSPRSYVSQLAGAKEKAAEETYQAARKMLSQGDRESAIEAFYLFERALKYSPGYSDARQRMNQARDLATLKVVVEPIPVPSRYKLNTAFFENQLIEYLNKQQEFVAYFNSKEARKAGRMDQVLEMEYFDFVIGSTKNNQKEIEVRSRDSVKVGSTTINGKKVDVFNIVKAKLTTNLRQVSSSGVLQVKIIDMNSKKVLSRRNFPGTYVWETEWASYNGDERALTKAQFDLCKKKPANPPRPQDLFYEFTKPIFSQTKNFLRTYYRQY